LIKQNFKFTPSIAQGGQCLEIAPSQTSAMELVMVFSLLHPRMFIPINTEGFLPNYRPSQGNTDKYQHIVSYNILPITVKGLMSFHSKVLAVPLVCVFCSFEPVKRPPNLNGDQNTNPVVISQISSFQDGLLKAAMQTHDVIISKI
jgi:hypothetical protein